MRWKMNVLSVLATALATCTLIPQALAQQDERGQRNRFDRDADEQQYQQPQQGGEWEAQDWQENQREADRLRQRQDRQQQTQQERQFRLRPSGLVRIAVDYDQDDRFDAMETIYYYDLVRARERSAERQSRQGRRQQQMQDSPDRRQRQQIRRISGRLTDLTTFRLNDGQQHRLGRLETEQGERVPVDLGRTEQVGQLDLQEGDRISVWGTRARINDRPVLSARRIETENRQVTIDREQDRNLKRVRGRIVGLRTARFEGKEDPFRVARIELNDSSTETVILGPQQRLSDLDLRPGDEVRLLVRPGRLNDQSALVAEQIRANGRTARIPRPDERRLTSRQRG